MLGHFLKWWAQAYQIKHSRHLGSILYHWHRHLYAYKYMDCWLYSKTCLKWPFKKKDQLSLNAGQKYCRMLQGEHSAIFLTFIKVPFVIKIYVLLFFEWLLKTGFTVLTTYMYFLFCGVCRLAVRWLFFLLKWDYFTTKKDGSTEPTALESDGPYFEIMGQWPGPTLNLKAWSGFESPEKNWRSPLQAVSVMIGWLSELFQLHFFLLWPKWNICVVPVAVQQNLG